MREFAIGIRKSALRLEPAKQLASAAKQTKNCRNWLVVCAWICDPEASEYNRNDKETCFENAQHIRVV